MPPVRSSPYFYTFSDPDDYAASIRATSLELTVTGRGRFTGQVIRIDLHRLWMQRSCQNLPQIVHSSLVSGRAVISFPTLAEPSQIWNGVKTLPSSLVRHSDGEHYYWRSSGPYHRGAMSLSVEDMASLGAAMAGCDLTPPRAPLLITPPPAAMARLQRLHAEAGDLAENAPEIIANPDAARGLEQALIEKMIGCLSMGEVAEDSVARRHHALIMRRFRNVLDKNPDRPLHLPEICAEIAVSDRTLRACCQEHLGMGPKRYLLVRRMHLARRALRENEAGAAATVSEIAAGYGFWHFGRFARAYRSMFGELPSKSLHRAAS
jgi:AraC-like DNA-binding protein